jgi:hypothetical protein
VPWTTSDPERVRELLAMGVDAICTNHPDVARQVLDENRSAASKDAQPTAGEAGAARAAHELVRSEHVAPGTAGAGSAR